MLRAITMRGFAWRRVDRTLERIVYMNGPAVAGGRKGSPMERLCTFVATESWLACFNVNKILYSVYCLIIEAFLLMF